MLHQGPGISSPNFAPSRATAGSDNSVNPSLEASGLFSSPSPSEGVGGRLEGTERLHPRPPLGAFTLDSGEEPHRSSAADEVPRGFGGSDSARRRGVASSSAAPSSATARPPPCGLGDEARPALRNLIFTASRRCVSQAFFKSENKLSQKPKNSSVGRCLPLTWNQAQRLAYRSAQLMKAAAVTWSRPNLACTCTFRSRRASPKGGSVACVPLDICCR
mmetsp:Transcript_73422/g.118470  ORF Transcript_73422/g.118470 Transcript_73422/m.118470 type:complete len:218 (+) Transcript_73422:250-903(+)